MTSQPLTTYLDTTGVLSKLSRFFTVVNHKETIIYAPPMPTAEGNKKPVGKKEVENTVWSIIVKKETEKGLCGHKYAL